MQKIYTGVGSRDTPDRALQLMHCLGAFLAQRGWTLRSGGADGADTAFEQGAKEHNGLREIFLPWVGFNGSSPHESGPGLTLVSGAAEWTEPVLEAVLDNSHFANLKRKQGALKLHCRNVHQILGERPESFISKLVICWTAGGELKGGTATAIKLARKHHVPVLNLGHDDDLERIWSTGPEDLEAVLMGWGNHDRDLK